MPKNIGYETCLKILRKLKYQPPNDRFRATVACVLYSRNRFAVFLNPATQSRFIIYAIS